MIPIPANITKNNHPRIQKNAIMETRIETRIERVSGLLIIVFAAANSVVVTIEALKESTISGTMNQRRTMDKRMNVAALPSPT